MPNTWVDIANIGLTEVGERLITSLDDATNVPVLAKANIFLCRDQVLRRYWWDCAKKRVTLSPMTEAPAFGYSYQFSLPSDWLKTRYVWPDYEDNYTQEGKKLLSDEDSLNLSYIYRVEDPRELDELCAEAIGLYFAQRVAFRLQQDEADRNGLAQRFLQVITDAKKANSIDKPRRNIDVRGWSGARRNPLSGVLNRRRPR